MRFALIGCGAYVSPRHLKAIRDLGHDLVAACDPYDSVGHLDAYFRECQYFDTFERFDRYVAREIHSGNNIDWLSVCTPNHFHDVHIRWGLRAGMNVICEKPLVVNPWNIQPILDEMIESGNVVRTVHQLRYNTVIKILKERVSVEWSQRQHQYDIDLTYITGRGPWYQVSWKGDPRRSGGIAPNVGIHFLDLLLWIFGPAESLIVHNRTDTTISGEMYLHKAVVRWFLSTDFNQLPQHCDSSAVSYRSFTVDGQEVDLSTEFESLHTRVYDDALNGGGVGPAEAGYSVQLAHAVMTVPEGQWTTLGGRSNDNEEVDLTEGKRSRGSRAHRIICNPPDRSR